MARLSAFMQMHGMNSMSEHSCTLEQLVHCLQVIRPFLASQLQNRGLKKPILCIVITDGERLWY